MSNRNYPGAFLHPFSPIPTLEKEGSIIIDRGDGANIHDDNGRRYLEANSGLWNSVLGFGSERLIAAAQRAYVMLPACHAFFGRFRQSAIVLAPSFIIEPAGSDELFDILKRTLDEVHTDIGRARGS